MWLDFFQAKHDITFDFWQTICSRVYLPYESLKSSYYNQDIFIISGIVSAVEMVVIMGICVKRILIVAETNGIGGANVLRIIKWKMKTMDLGNYISKYLKVASIKMWL